MNLVKNRKHVSKVVSNSNVAKKNTVYSYHLFDFKIKSSAMKLLKVRKSTNIILRCVLCYVSLTQCVLRNYIKVMVQYVSKFKILYPSIQTQNDIVEKLDKFHEYCTCLISGLPAEIEYRKKQYKYYLNKIFNQSEISDTYING